MPPVPFREILRFYFPLVLTSQMMTLSGPLINVAVGRSADPTIEFAGYWLGFAVLMFIEAPCFIIQQAAATLLQGHQSMRRLFLGATLLGAAGWATVLLFALTPAAGFFFSRVVHTDPAAAKIAIRTLVLLSPIPLIISTATCNPRIRLTAGVYGVSSLATDLR